MKATEPIKIALLAVGGDGGGVLTQWIVKLAEKNKYWAQSTSIAGVAQRTGATVYYMELFPMDKIDENAPRKTPILAQMPAPQDVDIMLCTELMEAGRAIQRGFVSKKTTIIFSTNRNLAIGEKEVPGDGIADGEKIFEMTNKYAKKSLFGNLKVLATKNRSVISASMFGALASSGTLPFAKENFIEIIKESGKGVEQSIAAFEDAYQYIQEFIKNPKPYQADFQQANFKKMPENSASKSLNEIIGSIKIHLPTQVHDMAWEGAQHLIDWQNVSWAKNYLEKLKDISNLDSETHNYRLTQIVAQNLAVAMAYDDLVFVADQKTRSERMQEVRNQVGAKDGEIVNTLDYLHPGFEEVTGFLPKNLGKKIAENQKYRDFYKKKLDRDRRMNSTGLFNFMMLYFIGGMRNWRMKTLRHHEEMENVEKWLQNIKTAVAKNYDLAVEIAKTYRLKKGYGDTYARGHSKFTMVNDFAIKNLQQENIAEKVNYLTTFALQHPEKEKTAKLVEELELN